ncbi:MAG TPA: AsmA family protein [Bacteroidota bacterium]
MSRKAKIWLVILAIPVILVVAGIVALKMMFTSEKLKSMVIPRAEAATGRSVAINDISLVVFPSIALRMEGVSISNRKGEGFSSTPLLTLDALRLNLKILPLLKSRIEVTSLELDRPCIVLEVNGRNETNYSNLTGGGAPVSPPGPTGGGAAPGGAAPPNLKNPEPSGLAGPKTETAPGFSFSSTAAFLVSNLLVNNGSVDYVNFKDSSATRVRNLSLALELGTEGDRIIISGNAVTDSLSYGTVETPMLEGLRLRFDSRMSYDLSKDLLEFEKGDMIFQDMRLALKGTVSHVRSNSVLDITVGSDSLNIADLFSLVPREYLKKAEGIRGTGIARIHIAVSGTLTDSTTADIAGTVAATGASIQYPQLPKPISDITLLSGFTRTKTKQEFHIEKMTANLGGAPFSMAMSIVNFDKPYLTLSAAGSLNLATVPEYYPLEKGTELGGEMKLDIHIDGKVSDPKSMHASGSMTFQDVSAKTAGTAKPVRKLNGTLTFNNEVAETAKLSLLIGESDMTLSCRVKNYLSLVSKDKNAPQSSATMTLQSTHLFARDIMTEQPPPVAGAQKQGNAQPASGTPEPPKTSQPAPARPVQASGKAAFPLPAMDIDASATIGTLTLEKFEFTNIKGAMRVSKGVVTMQNLSLNAFGGSVVSNGSVDLNKPDRPLFDLSLNLNGVEAATLLSHFTSFGQKLSGALTTSTKLKGALNDTLGLVPETVEGDGKVAVKNGSLKGFKVNQTLASSLKLPDLETIQFKDWGNDFTVQKGRLTLKDLTITASTGQYVVNGSQGLDGSLDYHMALYLPASTAPKLNIPGFAGEAVNLFKDQSGRLKLDFNIGGTTDNPKVQLDTDPAKNRAVDLAKQKLEDEKKKVGDQLKNKASDALKKLFKK